MSFFSKGRSSQFNPDVLNEKDSNGDVISTWCKTGFKKEEAICFVCIKTINCSQHGVTAVKRHAKSKGHIDNCAKIRGASGILKKAGQTSINNSFNLALNSHADKITKAEVLFCSTVAAHNLPYAYGNTATSTFPAMFDDSNIAKDFKCKSSKLSYYISDGLGPYFKEKLIDEVFKSGCHYSIQIDETPLPEKRVQQLDIILRYFSEKKEEVVVRHWDTRHIGSATSEILASSVEESLQCLPQDKLFGVFSDGPNVMKSFKKKMSKLHPDILDIGECVLHKVHNGFAKGLNEEFGDVESLIVDIFYFFKNSAVQSEKMRNLQIQLGLPEHVFVKHVSSRWTTLETSITRVVEQFSALQEFFQKQTESRFESQRLLSIRSAFNNKKLLPKLLFLKNVSGVFNRFLKVFQVESPMIHILYIEMEFLVKTFMGRFLKEEFFRNKAISAIKNDDLDKSENWCRVELGTDTERVLDTLPEKDKKFFRLSARAFYKAVVQYLIKKLPFDNKVLKNLKCLHPSYRLKEDSLYSIKHLAAQVPNILGSHEVSLATDEFIRLQGEEREHVYPDQALDPSDDESDTSSLQAPLVNERERLDKYWAHIFKIKDVTGEFKYKNLGKLIKPFLSLPHGNADVERGFSVNKHLLNSRSSLSIESIDGLRKVKCHIKTNCNNKVENIKVIPEMLKEVRLSHKRKKERDDRIKALKRANESAIKESSAEKEQSEEKELAEKLNSAKEMLKNANKAIENGIQSKNMACIESGQVLLNEATLRINNLLALKEKNKSEKRPPKKKKA